MSTKHEQCPQCRKDGRDGHADNLARYPDGSAFCFSCGYWETAQGQPKVTSGELRNNGDQPSPGPSLHLPSDVTTELPETAIRYLKQYSLDDNDVKTNLIMYSPALDRIIFPYFVDNNLEAWQGRALTEGRKPKWLTKGNVKSLYYFKGNPNADTVILVEDILSAIRLSKIKGVCSMPLFGSVISTKQLLTLHNRFKSIRIWLDKDKELYSQQTAFKARSMGIPVRSIVSELDPKCYSSGNLESFVYV